MSHALSQWRERFPILAQKTYLASHSLGAVPRETANALREYYEQWATLGISAWDGPWWNAMLGFCSQIERVLGARSESVVPMQNVTRGMAAVASCLDFTASRNKIVMTGLEFTTSYPLWRRCEELGAEIVIVSSDDGVFVAPEQICAAVDERVALVTTSHAYFRSGAVQDLSAIVEHAKTQGSLVLGDGYQLVGSVPIDVTEMGIDFYVGGCHKWLCGGAGAGYLYVRPDLVESLSPRLTGWFGLQDPFEYERSTGRGNMNAGVMRFLGGTPNVPAFYAAREGLNIILEIGTKAIREVSGLLTSAIVEQARERGYEIVSPTRFEARNGMVCVRFPGAEAAVPQLLDRGIVVDWRPDCGLRVSPHFYNNLDDISHFFSALGACRA